MLKRISNLVSIIVSNYNKEGYIGESLDALIRQSYSDIEIIVIDDGSTDKSYEVIKKYEESYPDKIVSIRLPRNSGFSAAVTAGLFLARGEYIAMQDSDDVSHVDRIEKQVNYLKENKDINAIGTNYKTFTNNIKKSEYEVNGIVFGVKEIKEVYSNGGNCICYGTLLIRGDVFDKIGGLTRRINGAEDYEFITRLLPYGIDNMEDVLYYYRRSDTQRSLEFYNKKKEVEEIKTEDLKILMVLDALNLGGTETHVLSLTKQLIREGIKVCILSGEGQLETEFQKLNIPMYKIDFPKSVIKEELIKRRYKEKFQRIIENEGINIIHSHQSPSGAIAIEVANELNIKSIFTVHGLYYQDIVSTILPRVDKIISVSVPVYEWLLKFNIQSRVIPNGLDFINENKVTGIEIRKELNIPEESLISVYCSRLAWGKTKACENYIRVCRDLRRIEKLDVHAIIIGEGPDFNDLQRVANKANQMAERDYIHLLGGKTLLNEYYNASDFVVGTGRVVIEGIVAKKPIIATGNDGYFGILTKNNFKEAWNVYFGDHRSKKTNNASFLYEDMRYMYKNYNELLNQVNEIYALGEDLFSIEKVVGKLIDIYEKP